jgi:SAM-dependent methyltransferase
MEAEAWAGEARASYDAFAPAYDQFTGDYDLELWLGSILAGLEGIGLQGKRLLDIGCGTGGSLLPMLSRGWEVSGCDISPAMLERARAKVGASVRLEVADIRRLPVFGEFDLVWALGDVVNYLRSVDELEQALRRMRENLAPGGLLAIDANTIFILRQFFGEETVVERDGRRLVWSGQASADAAPGAIYEARFEGEGVDGLEPHVHRQRHFPEGEILRALSSAGLECREVFGYGEDVVLRQPLNEHEHARGLYVASAPLPPVERGAG